MLPYIIVGASALIYAAANSNKDVFTMESNCHENFLDFESRISVSTAKRKRLVAPRKALEKRIKDYFKTALNIAAPKFYIQGSYKMDTMVLDKNGNYDVDLGVYFLYKPEIKPITLQTYIFDAVNGHTSTQVKHRDKCLRVVYAGEFDIDLPVYYKTNADPHPFLATKNGWLESDPKEMCDWFKGRADEDGQMIRLVKYFKAWSRRQNRKMPSGIAFSVWVADHYQKQEREDIAFYLTAKAIKDSFWWNIKCKNPATPEDNLIAKLTSEQKDHFLNALGDLLKTGKSALRQPDNTKALKLWNSVFGRDFA